MKTNRFRELLDEGTPTLGTQVISPWPRVVEVIGHTGLFDYIDYGSEHSNWSLEQLENFGRAIDLFPNMSSMIKVADQARGLVATKAIAAGIQNVLFAGCRDAEDVRECVRLVKPGTPEAGGSHGYNQGRIALGGGGVEEWVKAMNDVVIMIGIEKKSAMENLEEMLSVKGVDMIGFGANDYAISIGKPGQAKGAEVQKARRDVIEMALKKGVAFRAGLGRGRGGLDKAKAFIEMGVRHFAIGSDLASISEMCEEQGGGMRKLLASI